MEININEKLVTLRKKKKEFLKKRFSFWLVVFLIPSISIASIVDSIFLFPSSIRWVVFAILCFLIVVLLFKLKIEPIKKFTTKVAMDSLEKENNDKQQLLRTAYEIEQKETGDYNQIEKKVLINADEKIQGGKLKRDPWIKYKRLLKLLKIIGVVFLLFALFKNTFQTGVIRTLLPFSNKSYTRISVHSRHEFFPNENVEIGIQIKGKTGGQATIFVQEEGGEWKSNSIETNGQKYIKSFITKPKKNFNYYVVLGDGKSHSKFVRMIAPPEVNTIMAEIELPKYMLKKNKKQTIGAIKTYVGAKINLQLKISQPMKEAFILLPNKERQNMNVKGAVISFSFQVMDTLKGEYSISGFDQKGTILPKQAYKIQVLEDKLPTIKIMDPSKDIEVTPITELPIVMYAQDDIGLGEIGLTAKVDGVEKEIAHFKFKDSVLLNTTKIGTFLLENFKVEETSNVRVYAWAKDKNPANLKRGVSILRGIDIRPFRKLYVLQKPIEPDSAQVKKQGETLMKLEDMIQTQRNVVSKTFKYSEEGSGQNEFIKLATTEEKLSKEAKKIYRKINGKHSLAKNLLLASENLEEAAAYLKSSEVKKAFLEEEIALQLMMKFRNKLLTILNKNKSKSTCKNSNDQLTELAVNVDKLITQENEVLTHYEKYKINKLKINHFFDASSLQHKINIEAAELESLLEIHPDGTPLNLTYIKEARSFMKEANKNMEQQKNPMEAIHKSIELLKELAQHLRGLDKANPVETIKKARQIAKKIAIALEKQAKDKKTIGKKDDQDSNAKKKANKKGKKEGKKKGAKPGENKPGSAEGNKSGTKKGNKEGSNPGGNKMSISQMTREVEMIKDWLNNSIKKEDQISKEEKDNKKRTERLLEKAELDKLLKLLKKAGDNPTPLELERLAKKMNALSNILMKEELNLTMSKLDKLTSVKKLALSLKKQKGNRSENKMDLIEMLDMLKDTSIEKQKEKLKGLSGESLNKEMDALVKRLNTLIEELLKDKIDSGSDIQVPSKYKRLVEEYFKSLSDDMEDNSKI